MPAAVLLAVLAFGISSQGSNRSIENRVQRGVVQIPESFLINRKGQIQALSNDQLTSEWVDQTLANALKQSA